MSKLSCNVDEKKKVENKRHQHVTRLTGETGVKGNV